MTENQPKSESDHDDLMDLTLEELFQRQLSELKPSSPESRSE